MSGVRCVCSIAQTAARGQRKLVRMPTLWLSFRRMAWHAGAVPCAVIGLNGPAASPRSPLCPAQPTGTLQPFASR